MNSVIKNLAMWMRIRAAHNITLIFKYLWQPTTYLHVLTNNRDTRLMQHGGIIFRMSVLWTRDLTPGHSTFMDWLWASCSHMCLCHRAVSFDTGCSIIWYWLQYHLILAAVSFWYWLAQQQCSVAWMVTACLAESTDSLLLGFFDEYINSGVTA